jgi:hypothetical protein
MTENNPNKFSNDYPNPNYPNPKDNQKKLKVFRYSRENMARPKSTSSPREISLEKFVYQTKNLIIHLLDQRQEASRLSNGRITSEIRRLSGRIINAQADYKGMTGEFYHPDKTMRYAPEE